MQQSDMILKRSAIAVCLGCVALATGVRADDIKPPATATAPVTAPTTAPATAPAKVHTTKTTTSPATEPVTVTTTVPATAPAKAPKTKSTTDPAKTPTTMATTAPATAPAKVPVTVTTAPATAPVTVTTIPATAPVKAPVAKYEPVENADAPNEVLLTRASDVSKFGGTDRIAKLAVVLQSNPDYYLRITGHADAGAGETKAEAAIRAASVKSALVKAGIAESHLFIVPPDKLDEGSDRRYTVTCSLVKKTR